VHVAHAKPYFQDLNFSPALHVPTVRTGFHGELLGSSQREKNQQKYPKRVFLKEFLTIDDVSEYLGMRKSTLYLKVERREIPFYRFGRLIRFKKADIDQWADGFRHDAIDSNQNLRNLLKSSSKNKLDIESLVKKAIDGVKGKGYTLNQREPDKIKGLRKEAKDGTF
jgi:excisionase family DNA binding protein